MPYLSLIVFEDGPMNADWYISVQCFIWQRSVKGISSLLQWRSSWGQSSTGSESSPFSCCVLSHVLNTCPFKEAKVLAFNEKPRQHPRYGELQLQSEITWEVETWKGSLVYDYNILSVICISQKRGQLDSCSSIIWVILAVELNFQTLTFS